MTASADGTVSLRLRAFTEADLSFLDRLSTDPNALGEFEWQGFIDPRTHRRRWERDAYISAEYSAVAIVSPDDTVIGMATWKPRGVPAGVTYEIGIVVLPEHRGKGLGTAAQQALVDHLFAHTTTHRIEALTNEGNIGEQKALERLGFSKEGLMRERSFQHGRYVGVLVYALLRSEHHADIP